MKQERFVVGMFSVNYEELFEQNTDAILIVNEQGSVLKANQAFFAVSNYALEDIQNTSYEKFLQYEHDVKKLTALDSRIRFICQNKKSIPILARKIDLDGYSFIIMKDMRRLDAMLAEFSRNDVHYRIIAEQIQDVLILMDEHKNYLYVSPSAMDMYHFDYENLDSFNGISNIHEEDVAKLEALFDQAMIDGNSFTIKVRAWHAVQQWIWTELKGQPMFEGGQFQHMLFIARDVSTQHQYEETLLQHAYSDALTNLPNRRRVNEWLKDAKTVLQQPNSFAVMLMDVDNFKYINDYYGHEIGDLVLVEYSKRVSAVIANSGIVGRYGGDEFIAMLPYESQQEVEAIASRIIQEIQKPIEIQHTALTVTTSIGIALIEDDFAFRKMLKCADDALYKVKEQGKNDFYIADLNTVN